MGSAIDAGRPRSYARVAVLGVGLLGGSFALAARRRGLAHEVVGYAKSPSTLNAALAAGVIDQGADSALRAVTGADLVVLAVPVAATAPLLKQIALGLRPDCLLIDVGSTKADVAISAQEALGRCAHQFVPCHPIAGGELSGVQHARADLFEARRVVVTPLDDTPSERITEACALWERLGANVSRMTPPEHDAAFAAVSHLPHLLAFAYVQALTRQPKGGGYLQLAGPGFRDFTRIAASDAVMWRDVFQANGAEVLQQLQLFKQALAAFEAQLRQGNWTLLETLIRDASASRQAWSTPSAADDIA